MHTLKQRLFSLIVAFSIVAFLSLFVPFLGSPYESGLFILSAYVFVVCDIVFTRRRAHTATSSSKNIFFAVLRETGVRLVIVVPFWILLSYAFGSKVALAVCVVYMVTGWLIAYFSVHVPPLVFNDQQGEEPELLTITRKNIPLLLQSIGTAFFFLFLMFFMLYVTGFLPTEDNTFYRFDELVTSESFLLLQLVTNWSLAGLSMFCIWKRGRHHREVQHVTALYVWQMAIPTLFGFANAALGSYAITASILLLNLVVSTWAMIAARRISEFAAQLFAPIPLVVAIYLYYVMAGVTGLG